MLTPRDSAAAPNTQLDRAHGVPCTGEAAAPGQSATYHYPKKPEDVTETGAEVKRQRETESTRSLSAVNDLQRSPVNVRESGSILRQEPTVMLFSAMKHCFLNTILML